MSSIHLYGMYIYESFFLFLYFIDYLFELYMSYHVVMFFFFLHCDFTFFFCVLLCLVIKIINIIILILKQNWTNYPTLNGPAHLPTKQPQT